MPEQPESPLILVVDDQLAAAEMLTRLFTSNNYRVANAYNGEEAITQARQIVPDLILLDIMMPGMNGFEVLQQLRETAITASIPTIFITAKTNPADIEHGLQLGADDYIPKPVKPRELLARAKSKIEAHKLREALHRRTTDLEALLRVSEELNNHLAVDDLLDLILYLVQDLIPSDVAGVLHIDEVSDDMRVRFTSKDGHSYEDHIDIDQLLAEVDDRATTSWMGVDHAPLNSFAHGMYRGLYHGGQLHGIIVVASQNPYDEHSRRLFEGICRQATMALRNADLYQVKVNYAEHLEDMVEERTRELQSAQELLIRSEKLASVGRLAAGIAHEINNPLQPILVNMELMLEDLQSGQQIVVRDVEESLKSARRITRIVDRLLQFTRKRGDQVPDMEPLNVSSVIDDVVALSRTYIRKGGIEIELHIDPQIYIYGNRDQLEQVFLNLILNAKAAMEDGGILTIRTQRDGDQLILLFEDQGHGIEEATLSRIFEPFYSTKEEGSGLGLFISHGIIENHNGMIHVESEVGKGTTMRLSLPIIQDVTAET